MPNFPPSKKSRFERILFVSVLLSPVAVFAHFFFGLFTSAYPSDGDSIMIPIMGYFLFPFPLLLLMTFKGREGLKEHSIHLFWNGERNIVSLLWTVVSVYPIGLFLAYCMMDAFRQGNIPSVLYFILLAVALITYRAGAISRNP